MNFPAFQAAQGYNLTKTALNTPGAADPQLKPESAAAAQQENPAFSAIHELASAVAQGERAAAAYMTGGADPHSVIEAMAAAELAVETAVTVRDKVVEAYQELIRMPV